MAPQEPEQDASWVRTDGHLWARSGKASLHGRGPAGHWPPRIQETPSHKERVLPQQLSRPALSPKSVCHFPCHSKTPWIGVCQTTLQEDAVWVISSVCEINQILTIDRHVVGVWTCKVYFCTLCFSRPSFLHVGCMIFYVFHF